MLFLIVRVFFKHLGGVMVSVFVSSVVDNRFEPLDVVNPKLKFVSDASPLSTQ